MTRGVIVRFYRCDLCCIAVISFKEIKMPELAKKLYLKMQLLKLPKWVIFALLGISVLCVYQIYLQVCYLTNEAAKGAPCDDCSK